MHEEHLDRYARLLVEHALDLRQGQRLDIWGELGHRDFAFRVGEAAYRAGAGQLRYRFADPREAEQLISHARPEQIVLHYLEDRAWLAEVVRSRGALLLLVGKTDPSALGELRHAHPVAHETFTLESIALNRELSYRALDQRLLPATAAVCPTAGWACQVFPSLPEPEAVERFWQLVFSFTGADQDDPVEHARRQARRRIERAAALDTLAIRELHVRGGGNDLRVRLSPKARWQTSALTTVTGQPFCPNVPSFEVFTSPDGRCTEGKLVATRPVRLPGGVVVEGLRLEFRGGTLLDFQAASGGDAFARILEIDHGARRLGEFALVSQDSPIAACGQLFGHLLLDENAAAHVALGYGFPGVFEPAASTASQLEAEGCNASAVHADIPFGSNEVTIVATESHDGELVLLEQGLWAGRLRDL